MESYQPSSHSQPKRRTSSILAVILAILLIISIAAGTFLYYKYREAMKRANNPTEVLNEQSRNLVKELSELIVIDEKVDPTIATIVDIEALKAENPEFYKNGKTGDVIFIFPTRVILYDKEGHKIVNVAPIISEGDVAVPTPATPAPTSPSPSPISASPKPTPSPSPVASPTVSE